MNTNMDTTGALVELETALRRQLVLFTKLLDLHQEERDLIVQFKPGDLVKVAQEKEVIATEINEVTEALSLSLKSLGIPLGSRGAGRMLDWNIVFADADPIDQARINQLRDKLKAVSRSVIEYHTMNRQLIEFSIESVTGLARMMRRKFFAAPCYSRNAKLQEEQNTLPTVKVVA